MVIHSSAKLPKPSADKQQRMVVLARGLEVLKIPRAVHGRGQSTVGVKMLSELGCGAMANLETNTLLSIRHTWHV